MSIIRIDQEDIHYSLSGKPGAPVLVLSNSLGTSLDMWSPQEALGERFRLLRYDTRGHGRSAKPRGPYSLAQLGTDVLNLLDRLDIRQAAFCGISMGGLIGQWLGIHAPERFTHLALANTAARIGTEQAWLDRAATVRAQGMRPVAEGAASRWFTPDYAQAHADAVAPLLQALGAADPEGYASCCEALAHADLRDHIQHIKAPTLIIAGSRDPVTTTADADFMAGRIPGARRVDLTASHLSNIEAAAAFNDALLSFVGSEPAAG
ncbi:3-oxoadipate enol-lactonase [Parapusillimonas granuli]|uniref:3-oxoadipate enol-lactonase n=1 Tax=Parapusillimonas granuli TaxID=380911 RepID=A0A853G0H6_9BURK|nr:3-oxoadipate enol-lactonase [Parapusillimonas granuli]MBB5215954.1 3-oxoadipate enol-lactonase [Parapusillimonas granuli]MEB2399363.1 3-oxoadipate enol-lactonase [Alcaligenaceae bacterium]NYT50748.1 3-oxoadipate enol-lactonase [Parapusillimonas granuli]